MEESPEQGKVKNITNPATRTTPVGSTPQVQLENNPQVQPLRIKVEPNRLQAELPSVQAELPSVQAELPSVQYSEQKGNVTSPNNHLEDEDAFGEKPRQEESSNRPGTTVRPDPDFQALGINLSHLEGLTPSEMREIVNKAYRERSRRVMNDELALKDLNTANDRIRSRFGISR